MRKRELSAASKRAKGKRRCISNLFWGFLPFKFPPGRRFPLRARRRLRQPKSETVQPTSARQREETLEKERFIFINWVNSLVKMHQGQTLEEFRIDFPLEKNFSHVVDAWIQFALSKRLQRLVLDLSPTLGTGHLDWNYTFPNVLSPVTSSLSLVGLTSLTTLYLHHVNLKQEVVEHIISYCPVLEELSLIYSVFMGYFKIAGPALKLKHLSLLYCPGLKCLEICDTNIVSFKYGGWKNSTKLHLKNVPQLVELYVDMMDSPLSHAFDPISGLFSHLESLTLISFGLLADGDDYVDYFDVVAYPKLSKLRHLAVNMETSGDDGLLKLLSCFDHGRRTEEVVETIECPHQHLKVVELAGYYGRVSDVDFAMYLIKNAVALERMIIIPKATKVSLPAINTKTARMEKIKREEKARRLAKEQLKGNQLFCTLTPPAESFPSALSPPMLISLTLTNFFALPNRTTFIWNTIIRAFVEKNDYSTAISLYRNMIQNGFLPNNYTFSFVLRACTDNYSMGLGLASHAQVIKLAWDSYDYVLNGVDPFFSGFQPNQAGIVGALSACAFLGTLDHGSNKTSASTSFGGAEFKSLLESEFATCVGVGIEVDGRGDSIEEFLSWTTRCRLTGKEAAVDSRSEDDYSDFCGYGN
ncbi:hypothetical protein COLO4_22884 [Corchorus olitorius]|uniref:Uncharacterized protein n=1 Tax=Corchorus olitorius TaxID=93759 RepID=A0A1R3IJC4_9ROSI|nr:hypothetical protein COLO4_22884 [Corchorus olitorius]